MRVCHLFVFKENKGLSNSSLASSPLTSQRTAKELKIFQTPNHFRVGPLPPLPGLPMYPFWGGTEMKLCPPAKPDGAESFLV